MLWGNHGSRERKWGIHMHGEELHRGL
jgi:hypothetical protein